MIEYSAFPHEGRDIVLQLNDFPGFLFYYDNIKINENGDDSTDDDSEEHDVEISYDVKLVDADINDPPPEEFSKQCSQLLRQILDYSVKKMMDAEQTDPL